eukprot:SAG31_NODE_2719_length_5189_cov_4.394029_4_plen_129_part_00
MFTLHDTPCTPLHVNVPRQPTAHIDPFGKQPKVFPSTHSASDNLLVQEQDSAEALGKTVSPAVQFIIGVVNSNGEARIAHIENSVIDSSSVTFGGPSVLSYPDAGPVPVCNISRSFHPYGTPVASLGI